MNDVRILNSDIPKEFAANVDRLIHTEGELTVIRTHEIALEGVNRV